MVLFNREFYCILAFICTLSASSSLLRSALWRQKSASEAQKKFISKRWTKVGSPLADPEREGNIQNMTKGEAATIITRLRNGSQVRMRFFVYKVWQKLR